MRLLTFKIKSLELKFGNKRIKKYSLPLTPKSYFKESIINTTEIWKNCHL